MTKVPNDMEAEIAAELEKEFNNEKEIDPQKLKDAMSSAEHALNETSAPISVDLNGDPIVPNSEYAKQTFAEMLSSLTTDEIAKQSRKAVSDLVVKKHHIITKREVLETELSSRSLEAIEQAKASTDKARSLYEAAIHKADEDLVNSLNAIRESFLEDSTKYHNELNEVGRKIQALLSSLLGLEGALDGNVSALHTNTSPEKAEEAIKPAQKHGLNTESEIALNELRAIVGREEVPLADKSTLLQEALSSLGMGLGEVSKCPDCGESHEIEPYNIAWKTGDPKTAAIICPKCGMTEAIQLHLTSDVDYAHEDTKLPEEKEQV